MKDDSFIWRVRMLVSCVVLVAVAFVQQPGRIVADTKLDLVVDAGRFMGRATSLWDPIGYFGQVQNQAYGYFLPMGPFFWGGASLNLDPWVIQRLWWALVLAAAFLGFVLLARELRIGSGWAQIVGGFAFALSPRMLSVIGPSSIEVWPMAVAPWVLLPLVIGTTRRSPVAMAALSAVAVAAVGGVNAAATFAVIPLGALWLVMSPAGPRRRAMIMAWPGFVLMGTFWWLVPLVLLGRYSPPFLDFIESASLTSFDTNLLDSLRGTSNWTSYLSSTAEAGRLLVSEPVLLLNLAVLLALAVAGLARRDLPHRRFLFVSVLVGLLMVTMGHTATHGGLGANQIQQLLDGALSPLRNTHKFDVVIRIPLILAFVHLLAVSARQVSTERVTGLAQRFAPTVGVAVLGVIAVVGSTSPAWTAQLAPRGSFIEVPGYWRQTSQWLAEQQPGDRALVVPASSFGSYLWGNTNDDVMQALATSPWGVRNAIPLVPPGNIKMLDAVERELTDAKGSSALRQFLLDNGVTLLVVRNDLSPSADGLDPEIVHTALVETPGLRLVASFGPQVGGDPVVEADGQRVFIDQGWQASHPAVEVYRVGYRQQARAQDSSSVPTVVGASDSQVSLLASGLTDSPSVVFAEDDSGSKIPRAYILTDGNRRQEVAFGRVHDNRSASVALEESFGADRPVHEYASSDATRWSSIPKLEGARSITASSSQSSVRTTDRIDQAAQPWSAFDGDPLTSWRASSSDIGARSWIEIRFEKPTDVSDLAVTVAGDPVKTTDLIVTTDQESTTVTARRGRATAVTDLARPTRKLRISAPSAVNNLLAIQEVAIKGVSTARPLVLPNIADAWGSPASILLQADSGYRSGCLTIHSIVRCASGQDSWGEDGRVIDRVLMIPGGASYPLSLTVEPIGGAALDDLLQEGRLVTINATSQVVRSAQASAMNAVDGSERTAWIADKDDERPGLTVNWVGKRKVSSLRVRLDEDIAASPPLSAVLRFPDGTRDEVTFDANGRAVFDPIRTDRIEIEFTDVEVARSLDTTGTGRNLPVGVSEMTLGNTGLLPIAASSAVRTMPCGSGPTITVDGTQIRTRLIASPTDLLSGRQMKAAVCGHKDLTLAAGEHRITVRGTDEVRPVRLAMGAAAETPEQAAVTIGPWETTSRSLSVEGGLSGQLLTVTENTNKGWVAAPDQAVPVVVNGWQQGWQVPDSATGDDIGLSFQPNGLYVGGLVVGGGLLALLVLIAGLLVRRNRDHLAATGLRTFRRREGLLAGVVLICAGLLLGGWTALLAAAFGYAGAFLVRRFVDTAVLAGAIVGVPALVSVIRPWGGASTWLGASDWPQVMIAVACGVVASSVFGLPKRRSRSAGVSTNA